MQDKLACDFNKKQGYAGTDSVQKRKHRRMWLDDRSDEWCVGHTLSVTADW